ncbi:hypothetical protein COV19_06955 [Candidatus Woesearchaeota archaeon CG10_big_fil_rev_8_21_14_0_10_44_13]|nr:MAG: hypothetical protein COV19_06955 [Candidatus Woesearchaeota archaeon CG10_big_fil_rev_8_21_14_0_10_44_13]
MEAETKPKILYVEDANLMQVIIAENLRLYYQIFPARNGLEALEKMAQEAFDAVLLDINMPELSGYQFLGIIRGTYGLLREDDRKKIEQRGEDYVKKALQGAYKGMPVIVMSTDGMTNERRIMELGADAIVLKPYQNKKLLLIGAIDKVLAEKKANEPFSGESG